MISTTAIPVFSARFSNLSSDFPTLYADVIKETFLITGNTRRFEEKGIASALQRVQL